jgi:hypothetical protein
MIYVIINDLNNPNNQVYGIMTDTRSDLLEVIDSNCQSCILPTEHTIGETIDTPPCAQP